MANRRTLSLFVFIDAFGWEILRRRPFLDGVLETRAPLGTIFGYSSTCDPTILTGRLPREHGHFSFLRYDPAGSPFRRWRALGRLPRFLTRRGRVRRWISRLVGRGLGYTGYFQLYNTPFGLLPLLDYSEKRDLYQPGGINGGQPTVFDHLRARGTEFYLSDWRAPEKANLATLRAALTEGRVTFGYLYLAAMDAVLHADGTDSPRVDAKIAWYETELRRLLDLAAAHYRETRLFIFSDHGMTNVTGVCDLMGRVNALGLRFGEDYAAVYDSTMARFWFLRPSARARIEAVLGEEPRGRMLSDETLAAWGCDFPDRRYGELFFLMNPGVLLCPSFMGETRLAGMHGYEPEHPDSVAMFCANAAVAPPRRLDDLYALMRAESER